LAQGIEKVGNESSADTLTANALAGVALGGSGLAQGIDDVGKKESSVDTSTTNAAAGVALGGNRLAQGIEEVGKILKESFADTSTANASAGVALGSNGLVQGVDEVEINKESPSGDTLTVNASAGLAQVIEEAGKTLSSDISTTNTVTSSITNNAEAIRSNLQPSGIFTTENDAMVVDSVTNDLEAPPSNLQPSKVIESDKNNTDPAPITNAQDIDSNASQLGVSISGNARNYLAASYVTEMSAYFQGISKDDAWVKLVDAWLEFEKTCHIRGVSCLVP
jgi:hypothetical protein